MPNIDISRDATEPRKHYDRVQMQQGRVLTDDDFNEAERLDAEDARRVRVDVIGPAGSPDDGFKLKVPAGGSLTLSAGTFYVGGLRVELESDEAFALQKDWLQQGSALGETLAPPAGERFDFVWLDVWQQPVSAVEDKELIEEALGGADTSARIRTMRRARVLPDVGNVDCAAAWARLLTSLSSEGTIQSDFELVPNSSLMIEPDGSTDDSDLCSPSVNGGYLGAENQAIRVQIIDSTHFTWGFDNAAPLYRVKLLADSGGALRRLYMLTVPKDQAHYPLEGQVVELLPWSALLSNGQKTAEMSGLLSTVRGGYNPDSQELIIDAVPATFGRQWNSRSDQATISNETPPEDEYFYMRVWNRGGDTTSPAALPFTAGTPVPLTGSGLRVTFTGTNFSRNDHWIIAVRPETPDRFVPWEFSTGRRPHGVHRWIAPLGIIRWSGGTVTVRDDCRPTFLPLTRLKGCCTYTVGDGSHSFGNFSSIQVALAALPREGGQICVLPGRYRENVVVQGVNIKIHGCGKRSRVEAGTPAGGAAAQAVFTIQASQNIVIENLAVIAAADAPGVLIERAEVNFDVRLSNLYVEAARRSGIEVRNAFNLTIDNCEVIMADQFSAHPAVFVAALNALIERNTLLARAGDATDVEVIFDDEMGTLITIPAPVNSARGGLQIAGLSGGLRIRDNLIAGGIGNGITLGSFREIGGAGDDRDRAWIIGIESECEGCEPSEIIVVNPGGDGGDDGPRFVSAGTLSDILIQQNRIYGMGLCGIGVAGFFDLSSTDEFISVLGLKILQNEIKFCLRHPLAEVPPDLIDVAGFGGISLADVENVVINDNDIIRNGRSGSGDPICGIFILHGEGIDINRNRILDNGPQRALALGGTDFGSSSAPPKVGRRGGINIGYALAPTSSLFLAGARFSVTNGIPAVRIHDNIVTTPIGQALSLMALGAVSVEGNQFTSRGVVHQFLSPSFFATTVFIFNLGITSEIQTLPKFLHLSVGGAASEALGFDTSDLFPSIPDDFRILNRIADGDVMFVDNQVTLDLLDPNERGITFPSDSISSLLNGLELSSTLIVSLDDVEFNGNQCECLLSTNQDGTRDFILTNAALVGFSVRMADNRMKEGIVNALLSAVTFGGLMNATTNNQGTHCFFVYSPVFKLDARTSMGWRTDEGNRVLIAPSLHKTCSVECLDAKRSVPRGSASASPPAGTGQVLSNQGSLGVPTTATTTSDDGTCIVKCEADDRCLRFVLGHMRKGFFNMTLGG